MSLMGCITGGVTTIYIWFKQQRQLYLNRRDQALKVVAPSGRENRTIGIKAGFGRTGRQKHRLYIIGS